MIGRYEHEQKDPFLGRRLLGRGARKHCRNRKRAPTTDRPSSSVLSGGILYAEKISFKETMKLEGNAGSNGSADLLGLSVAVTSRTEYSDLPLDSNSINSGDGLRVRGFLNLDGSTITATRIDKPQ